ncbi:hypothetical protein [Streptomyces glomeratus]|uniref:Uncharacterized protein n=1 Tax=Streptomyces glomeratus TaxID=284452 RepID=A0ABP6LWG4_9ACTN|nr:hypothetical protein [Streptomyces glomeratus]MCF1512174.1 hypothetical protein [Streptomyces glomeratus]
MTVTVRTDGGHRSAQVVFKNGPDPKPAKKEQPRYGLLIGSYPVPLDPSDSDHSDRGKLATWQKVVLGVIVGVAATVVAAPAAVAVGGGCLAAAPVCAAEIAEMATGGASGGSMVVGSGAVAVGAKALTADKSMPEGPVTLYGPFHRLANPKTQSTEVARSIVESGELWGRARGREATPLLRRGVEQFRRMPSREAWSSPPP